MPEKHSTKFEQMAQEKAVNNILTDLWYFLRHSKKWWLLPVLFIVVLFGAVMLLSGTAAAPFIYTLF